jgi:hypothetical protein
MVLRSKAQHEGKPRLLAIGARRAERFVRADLLHAATRIRKGRHRAYLHDDATTIPITVLTPSLAPGVYEHVTLEVAP